MIGLATGRWLRIAKPLSAPLSVLAQRSGNCAISKATFLSHHPSITESVGRFFQKKTPEAFASDAFL
ncbi:MAG: hypothetical protein KDN20_19785 [Verrucomicrobiae bacterium]|nr:hypothetical protein [Verrucomicrobiae bacterium]